MLEVNHPHSHTRGRRRKIDAEMAARHALSSATVITPKQMTGIVDAIRRLRVARNSAGKSRSVAIVQGDPILTAPSELREQLATRKTLTGKAGLCRRLCPDTSRLGDPVNAAKLALRSLARRITLRGNEITELDTQLTPLVATAAPRTTALLGSPPATPGNCRSRRTAHRPPPQRRRVRCALRRKPDPGRVRQTRPLPPEPGGDRQANRALHMIAVCRLRYCPATRVYAARRTTEGKTKKDIMRCLKRYIARQVYANPRQPQISSIFL